jgi:hypothetical protein
MGFRISPLAAVLALSGAAGSVRAQVSSPESAASSLALTAAPAVASTPRLAPVPALTPVPGPAPGALKSVYRIRLTSRWPQESVSAECRNGGLETLAGTLDRKADGTYAGSFTRETRLLFCGAHGPATAACSLDLEGKGRVAMTGVVMGDDTSPSGRSIRVTWTPAAGHQAAVTGDCAEGFKQAVRGMYLSTLHAAEFPLTTVGSGPRTDELESYAWRVEVE